MVIYRKHLAHTSQYTIVKFYSYHSNMFYNKIGHSSRSSSIQESKTKIIFIFLKLHKKTEKKDKINQSKCLILAIFFSKKVLWWVVVVKSDSSVCLCPFLIFQHTDTKLVMIFLEPSTKQKKKYLLILSHRSILNFPMELSPVKL